jgi:TrpR-related protein YerC/YecD
MAYDSKLQSDDVDLLFDAILALENREECYRFFEDVSTIAELRALAQRFHIAKLLSEGVKYQEIERLTKASTATISRVGRCLRYGAEGYRGILKRLGE